MFTTKKLVLLLLVIFSYSYGKVFFDDYRRVYNKQVVRLLDKYESGKYSFERGRAFNVYKPYENMTDIDVNGKPLSIPLHSIEDREDCLGLKTEISEVIVLDCPDGQPNEPGCYYIYSSVGGDSDKERSTDETKVEKSCVEILNRRCVGIVTPNFWTVQFQCIETQEDR